MKDIPWMRHFSLLVNNNKVAKSTKDTIKNISIKDQQL